MNKLVDLHLHTTASDGTLTSTELLREIEQTDIVEFAVTDHDRLSGTLEMQKLVNEKAGYVFHIGAEISTSNDGGEYHLTAYDFDPDSEELLAQLARNVSVRRTTDMQFIKDISGDYDVDVDEFNRYCADPSRGGWPSLNYLHDKKIAVSLLEYRGIYTGSGAKMVFDPPDRVISAVHSAGGWVCLAHPGGYYERIIREERQLDMWRDLGIDGIECYHSVDSTESIRRLHISYADRYDMYVTGGSDYHGAFAGRHLATPRVTSDMVRLPERQ
jgi:3',5'-nucleoside bisphosphate phosphatase